MATKKALLGFSCIVLLALAGCTTKLGAEDRALLTETRSMAEAAKDAAMQAAADARAAREDADRAAKAAEAAAYNAEKSDRIFHHQQEK